MYIAKVKFLDFKHRTHEKIHIDMKTPLLRSRPVSEPESHGDDWGSMLAATVLVVIVFLLLAFGLTMVYSTTAPKSGNEMFLKQCMWAGVGLAAAFGITILGPKRLTDWRMIILTLLISWALLVLARFYFAPIKGAYRWVQLPGASIQPSEIAKFVCIVLIARWSFDQLRVMSSVVKEVSVQTLKLVHREGELWWQRPLRCLIGLVFIGIGTVFTFFHEMSWWRFVAGGIFAIPGIVFVATAFWATRDYTPRRYIALVAPPILLGVTLGLIFLGRDLGMTLLTAVSAGAIIFIAGLRIRWVLLGASAVAAGIWYLCKDPDSFRYKRMFSFRDPESAGDAGFQIWMSLLALGSGGVWGRGLGEGRLKTGYLPEDHTDCILSIAGEELGMIALLCVVALFVVMLMLGIFISVRANNKCSLLLGSGFTVMLGFQMFINIAVITSSMPAKGMPAPFISYGGSNMVVSLMSVGVLCAIAIESSFPHFHDKLFGYFWKLIPFTGKS